MWGDRGFPGEEDADIEVAAIIPGTLVSWRLDELDDRCRFTDDEVIDCVRASFDSRIS